MFDELFDPLKNTLSDYIDEVWSFKRTDCDVEKPDVPKPELSKHFYGI